MGDLAAVMPAGGAGLVPQSRMRRSWALAVLLGLGALVWCWLVTVSALDRVALGSPRLAAWLTVGQGRHLAGEFAPSLVANAWKAEAQAAAEHDDLAALDHAARIALRHQPYDPDNAGYFGLGQAIGGDMAAALRAETVSARFGWRSLPTQLFWFGVALDAGDPGKAALHADALMRAGADLPGARAAIRQLEAAPGGVEALAARLVADREWLDPYLADSATLPPEALPARLTVLRLARSHGVAPDCSSAQSVARDTVNHLVAVPAQRAAAAALWDAACAVHAGGGLVDDPRFARGLALAPVPFEWQVESGGDLAVHADMHGLSVSAPLARDEARIVLRQTISAAPGPVRLVWRGMVIGATQPPVVLACENGARLMPAAAPVERRDGGEQAWLITPHCVPQQVRVVLPPHAAGLSLSDVEVRR